MGEGLVFISLNYNLALNFLIVFGLKFCMRLLLLPVLRFSAASHMFDCLNEI